MHQLNFKIQQDTKSTQMLVFDAILDLQKEFHKMVREGENHQKFIASQIHNEGKEY